MVWLSRWRVTGEGTGARLDLVIVIFSWVIPVLLAATWREAAKARAAVRLGLLAQSPEKRTSLSLLENIDPLGTVALPLLLIGLWMIDSSAPPLIFAFAKPFTVDPAAVARRPIAAQQVHAAGLIANAALAVVGAILLYFAYLLPGGFTTFFVQTCRLLVLTNLMLLFIHLIPVPPFDLGRILFDRDQSLGADWVRKGLLGAGGVIALGAMAALWIPGAVNPFVYVLWPPTEFLYNQTIIILHAL